MGSITGHRALDVGCGKGYMVELLARAGADVVGYDQSWELLWQARSRLLRCGTRATLLHSRRPPGGQWDVVAVIGAADALTDGSVADALPAAGKLLHRKGWLVFADGYWIRQPDPALLCRLAPEARRMTTLPQLLEAAENAGLLIEQATFSAQQVWDDHMSSYCTALASTLCQSELTADVLRLRLAGRLLWRGYLEDYRKLNSKKYSPIAAWKESRKVCSGRR